MVSFAQLEPRAVSPIRVLLIEDDPDQAAWISRFLHNAARQFTVTWARTLAEAVARLAESDYDVSVVDLGLPDSHGLTTFDAVFTAAPHIPAVVITSDDNEEVALAALRRGAQDYLVKGDLRGPLIPRSLCHAIERHRLEEQLRQSQKNEAIGALADGIAHEFNNLLQVIVGYTHYALEEISSTDSGCKDLEQVLHAADRGVQLTRQLLDLSRPRPALLRDTDVGRVVSELAHLLRPLLGEQVRLERICLRWS